MQMVTCPECGSVLQFDPEGIDVARTAVVHDVLPDGPLAGTVVHTIKYTDVAAQGG